MSKGRTQKIIERNRAEKEIGRLRREGRDIPLSLLQKVAWNRKIVRSSL